MSYDTCFLNLKPIEWFQSITYGIEHEEGCRLIGNFKPEWDTEVELSNGRRLHDLMVNLPIYDREPWTEQGIGVLNFLDDVAPNFDRGFQACIGGGVCLTHEYYVELWEQLRQGGYSDCRFTIQVAPLSVKGMGWLWDVSAKRKQLFILGASVCFTRGVPIKEHQSAPDVAPVKKGLFSWR
jgi:hypothetical protein